MVHECRQAYGLESPEAALEFKTRGYYTPCLAGDIWAFGQLLIDLLGARQPEEHEELTGNQDDDGRQKYMLQVAESSVSYYSQVRPCVKAALAFPGKEAQGKKEKSVLLGI